VADDQGSGGDMNELCSIKDQDYHPYHHIAIKIYYWHIPKLSYIDSIGFLRYYTHRTNSSAHEGYISNHYYFYNNKGPWQ
jgi:hypothetical protein